MKRRQGLTVIICKDCKMRVYLCARLMCKKCYGVWYRGKVWNKERKLECTRKRYMIPEFKQKMKEYSKKYYAENKQKINEYYKKYYEIPENKQKINEYNKKYYKKYYAENKQKIKERSKKYREKPENKQKIKERSEKYYAENKQRRIKNE